MAVDVRYFSPEENTKPRAKRTVRKAVKVTGYISSGGKIVLPQKSVSQLGIDFGSTRFRVGVENGKRKIKSLIIVPAADEAGTFAFSKAAKSYTLNLGVLLGSNGVDFGSKKYSFTVSQVAVSDGGSGYELKFDEPTDKPAYTGKRRGPKPKNQAA
jgi:hypothetical protein